MERLRELGWIEGRTIAIEYRWSEDAPSAYAEIAAEFVRLKVDVIVTYGTAVPTVKQATTVIPIVFAVADRSGRRRPGRKSGAPGGNVTGLSIQATDVAGKRLELLREIVPRLRRLAIMVDFSTPQSVLEMGEVQAAARALGIEVAPLRNSPSGGYCTRLRCAQSQADALYVVTNALVNTNRTRIITLALNARLPTIFSTRDLVQAGGLMSYGQTTRLSSGTPPSMSTRFCAGRSQAIFRSSSRPNLIWSST